MAKAILRVNDCGIYCEAGGFYVDPWRPVDRAIVTHAHSDHARVGMKHYLCSAEGYRVTRRRLGDDASIESLEFGEQKTIGSAKVSLHPAGHILGSAQVRIEVDGQIAVVSGDYKTDPDPTTAPFEPIRCHLFITESTFGLPIYRWPDQASVFAEINAWWRANQAAGRASLLMGYALGKAQRALSGLDPSIGDIYLHGSVHQLTELYREQGVNLPATKLISEVGPKVDWSQAMIVAPPSASGSPWVRRFGDHSTAFCSGWMAVRGTRRRRALDRGFVLSDHVDWPSLLSTIQATQAQEVWVTHGYRDTVVRYLTELGMKAKVLETQFEGELDDQPLEVAEA
ncbi:MAG TPA: ligase-associated DNA damage response exonuclease [Fimbriimonadaceae bacterium]|nr:ligase-associated DNA damage response exonuclease [Fimbriimonadaceae bacterium]